jgi:hypothetical protein
MMTRFVLVPAFLILLPASASPQGLGDAAAKERERKAKSAPPAKAVPAFSNDDLASEKEKKRKKEEAEARGEKLAPEAPPEPAPSEEGRLAEDGRPRLSDPDRAKERARGQQAPDGVARDAVAPDGTQDEVSQSEAEWRARVQAARNRIQELEGRYASVQARVDEMRARLNPMSPRYEQDVNQILALQQEITGAESEAASARKDVDDARAELAGLEEKARQAGVPPGWLRLPQ